MKLFSVSSVLCLLSQQAYEANAQAVATIPCPAAGAPPTIIPSSTTSNTTVHIPVISNTNGLCTLLRHNSTDNTQRAPVARSYANRNNWEASAGLFSGRTPTGSSSMGRVVVNCDAPWLDPAECEIVLPPLEHSTQEYILESFEYETSMEVEAARFLEQATFGPTRETIDDMVTTSNDFQSWIYDQMYNTAPSSLRKFYRERVNPKWEHSYHSGTISSMPCDLYSRWRKYAISSKDLLQNRKTDIYKILVVTHEAGIGYVWKVDAEFRTVTEEPPVFLKYYESLENNMDVPEGVSFQLGARYRLKYQPYWQTDCIGCIIPLLKPTGPTTGTWFGGIRNPEVNFFGYESQLEFNVVNLPTFKSPDLPVIDNPDEYDPLWEKFFGHDENAILNTPSLEDSAQCTDMYNFRQPRLNKDWALGSAEVWKIFPTVFGKSVDGHMFLYDPHLALPENTVENPSPDGGGQLAIDTAGLTGMSNYNGRYDGTSVGCQNAVMSYENEANCKLSHLTSACTPGVQPKEVIVLNDAILEGIRAATGLKLYAVSGWTIEASSPEKPCGSSKFGSQNSRWIKDEVDTVCDNSMNLGEQSIKLFQDIIDQRDHKLNDNIVDAVKSWRACDTADETRYPFPFLGKVKTRDGSCWKHSHKNDMNVYDLSSVAGVDSYITPGSSVISVSEDLYDIIRDLIPIGRFGDHLEVNGDLKAPLNGGDIQATFKSYVYNPAARPVLICGTPNEVASDPLTGERGFTVVEPEGTGFRRMKIHDLSSQRHTIWYHLSMKGADQLRLRMAWALSQIITIGLPGSGMTFYEVTEDRLAMYDLYVRGAFGSYRDMLKDFSYNKIMASWLSFFENASLEYNLSPAGGGGANFPDENYAREIMQLFSIGLYQLNMDGTNVLLDNGKLSETYTIEDILSYSRAWTGFTLPRVRDADPKRSEVIARGGNSLSGRQWTNTAFEPMEIAVKWRDLFPKTDLMNGYIGDRLPLCVDLPQKHALRKGAIFKLLGSDQRGMTHGDPLEWDSIPDLKRLELSSTSPLFAKLCAEGPDGECTFPSLVELDENLIYDVNGNHPEYAVDTIRTLKLRKGESGVVNYEYIRQPCVEQSFFENGKKVFWGGINGRKSITSRLDGRTRKPYEMEASMCSHPSTEAASAICSSSNWETSASYGFIHCNYHGERVTLASAEETCQANQLVQGQPAQYKETQYWAGPCGKGMGVGHFRSWTTKSCGIKVKVDFKSGHIAIVHNPADDGNDIIQITPRVEPMVSEAETMNFFKAPWTNGAYPDDENKCLAMSSSGTCKIYQDESPPRTKYCVCDTDTRETQVFTSLSGETWTSASGLAVSSIDDLMNVLYTGAVDPSAFDAGTYTNLGDCGMVGITVYTINGGSCSALSSESIFAFEWKSKLWRLKNVVSMVHIDDATGNDYSFRNPVQFHSLANPSARDSAHETEAVIDSLFYHPTHPPFLAIRVIQRFGISNPSPGFIHRVATAYSTGTFGQFGSGKYGDLGAMAAAILLDDEARQVVLDKDQSHGHLREPLIKVLSFFRSQGMQYKSPLMVPSLIDLTQGTKRSAIGQGAFESPSVFSFFLPEFSPPGVTQSAGIFAPESMVFQGGNLLDLMEGIMSITKFGNVNCDRVATTTFSRIGYKHEHAFNCPTTEGDTSYSPDSTSYWPSSTSSVDDILDELALLMTAGRLSSNSRSLIKPIVSGFFNSGDISKAVRAAQQLIWSSPEVHATSIPRITDSPRLISGYETPVDPDSYKAVVVLMLLGGADSFNMLVPKQEDIWLEYARARGSHKLFNDHLLPLGVSGYGVHPALTTIANLYDKKDALWIKNLGTLAKPMTNADDYVKDSKFQLYAHNTMQHEFYTCDPYEENPGTGVFGRMLDKLKVRGYHTSANSISGGGGLMLTGDQKYNNPVFGIGLNPPSPLDKTPTVENLYDTVKEINGIGEVGNSFLSDTWSSRLSTALFEHEQLRELAEMTEFNINDYVVDGTEPLTMQLRKVAEFIKSRNHRKVNRDVFVVPHQGYDLHSGDTLVELITVVNDALDVFVKEMKAQDIWDDTVIVMGSDFGRTLNANANGGSDHAWGGNYFILGGGIKGGQLLGEYPRPLDATNEFFIPRGRLIPSTPWDAIWNGIANWLGLYLDEDLDFTLPNRDSFDKCNDLFFDKDLFTVGTCDCNGCSNINTSPSNTLKPTSLPTNPPPPTTSKPTRLPTPAPIPGVPSTMMPTTSQPSKLPTPSPTTSTPTTHTPTLPLPQGAVNVNSIFETDSNVIAFGCDSAKNIAEGRAIDGTTEKFVCLKSGTESPGIIVNPSSLSVAKGLRIYSHNNCPSCDAVSYIVEGRANGDWTPITQGDLPWKDGPIPDRNARGSMIESSVSEGDASKEYAEVSFENDSLYKEYRLTFPQTRDPSSAYLQFSEVELTGYVIEEFVTASPVTAEPTIGLTMSPTPEPITMMPTSFEPTSASSSSSSTSSVCEGNLLSNANFEDGTTDWRAWGGASFELTTGVTGNGVKAYGRTTWRSGPRQDIWPDDLACLKPGTFVHFDFKVRLVDDVTGEGVACDTSSSTDCPMVTVRHATWDYVYDQGIGWDPNNWNSFHGVYQVPGGAWTTSVYIMICGGKPGTSLIVDDVSVAIGDSPMPTPNPTPLPTTIPTPPPTEKPSTSTPTEQPSPSPVVTNTCEGNLLSNGNFEEIMEDGSFSNWRAWSGASVELTTGVTGNAVKAFGRTAWRSGPRQDLDDLTCLVPGTFVHFEFKARLVDDVTGEGVACDPSSTTDCPMVTIRHSTWDYVYDRYNNADWDPNNWNSFHGVYQVPTGAWSTGVYLMVCGGQPGTSLIVDDISMVIGDSFAPTPNPSSSPIRSPSKQPSLSPTTSSPVAAGGTPTNNIFDAASTIVTTGCTMDKDSTKTKSIDGTTSKFMCFKEAGATEHGVVISPGHGALSVAQSLRIYTHNNCPNCDGVTYKLQGRTDASNPWVEIDGGNLPWFDTWLPRNAQSIAINSSYESGDGALEYTEVAFPNNSQQFLEYRLVFTATRVASYYLQLGEVELVGVLY